MVERIMLLKLHDSEQRMEVAKAMRSTLLDLVGVEDFSVGLPADVAAAKSWDISVVLLFSSEAATSLTLASEGFTSFMDTLATQAQVVKAWNFERVG